MKTQDGIPCDVCGKPTWSRTLPERGFALHRDCAPPLFKHGTEHAYRRRKCRCDICVRETNRRVRELLRRRRAEGYIRPSRRDVKPTLCDWCGKRLRSNFGSASDGLTLCRDHRQQKTELARADRQRRASARRRLAVAAKGKQSSRTSPFVQGTCAICGVSFIRNGAASPYCSKRCGRKGRGNGKFVTKRQRTAIYERDDWICQLCFGPVNPTLYYLDDMAASLDHIVCRSWTLFPDHSPENLRLAHRLCNSIRGDESWPAKAA